jgi:alkanesulfonate monooxygenase SsuD/methylene tetrahydromethanopterin reductase-like flavin-dependent oxidoreductase (luciferase family)
MPLKVGVLVPTREAVLQNAKDADALLAFAERAEQLGFDSVWVGDSLLARPRHEPLTLLAAIAARTRRVELGTAVLISPLRHPLALAQAAATVDQISHGRLILGLGMASAGKAIEAEFAAVGVPHDKRAGRMREALKLLRQLWSARPITFKGRYWTLDNATMLPPPVRPGGPLLWVGGSGPFSLKCAGELSAGWFPNSPTPEAYRAGWHGVAAAAQAAGRPMPTRALYFTVTVGDDAARAQADMQAFMERYYPVAYQESSKRQGCAAGTLETVLARTQAFLAEGIDHLVLRFGSADQAGQLERAGMELLPALRKLGK